MRNHHYVRHFKFFCSNLGYTQLYYIRHFLHSDNIFFSLLKYDINSVCGTVPALGVKDCTLSSSNQTLENLILIPPCSYILFHKELP
jgi:hypothetical protein